MTPALNREARLKLRVTPRARKNHTQLEGDLIRVWVTATPDKGSANRAVIDLLARKLGVAKSKVSIVSGEHSRDKLVSIADMDEQEAHERLQ